MTKVVIFFGNFSFGGAEVVGVNLANSYANKGMEVTVCCLNESGGLRQRLSPKVSVVSFNTRLAFCLIGLRRFILTLDKQTVFISTIRNLNVVVSLATIWSLPPCSFIYREANTYRNMLNKGLKGVLTWLSYAALVNWAYRRASAVVANSKDTRADLRHLCVQSVAKRVSVIGNPIKINADTCALIGNEPPVFNESPSHPTILSVGRLHPQKDYFLGLKVFRMLIEKLPSARYVILGDGTLKDDLKCYARSLGLTLGKNIVFAGNVANPEYYYSRSDLFFMTSQWEGFGNVIVEAMGYGVTPVVCKCPGGARDIIGQEYGYYINSRSAGTIALSLEKALKNKITKTKLTKRARHYASDHIAEQYLDIMK